MFAAKNMEEMFDVDLVDDNETACKGCTATFEYDPKWEGVLKLYCDGCVQKSRSRSCARCQEEYSIFPDHSNFGGTWENWICCECLDDLRCSRPSCTKADTVGDPLMICDSCPTATHVTCAGLESFPEGDWNCAVCTKKNKQAKKTDGTEQAKKMEYVEKAKSPEPIT